MCTLIGLTAEAFAEHVEGVEHQQNWQLRTSASFDLRHRELVAACRRGVDEFEATERVLLLLSELPQRTARDAASDHRAATRTEHRRLVEAVQEAFAGGHLTAGLDELARLAGSSPHHLSRVFRRLTGRTVTAYRNDLRVRAVLEDLAQGATDVAGLAATYGFADHAQLDQNSPPAGIRPTGRAPPQTEHESSSFLGAFTAIVASPKDTDGTSPIDASHCLRRTHTRPAAHRL